MKIELSIRTVLFTFAVFAGLWLVGQIADIIILLFISFLLMTAILPVVVFLERMRIPRVLGILTIYLGVIGLFGASIVGAIPTLVTQSTHLVAELPAFVEKILPYWNIDYSAFTQQVAPIGESIVKVTLGIFSNFLAVITVLVFTFYFLMERRHAQETLTSIFGNEIAVRVLYVLRRVERRLGAWVTGQLILMTVIGVFTYAGLLILHVEFALPLAILAGLLEVVPTIGPVISSIPAILVSLSVSPFLTLSVVALYIVVQQLEGNILVPIIMKSSVGFPPLLTILVLLIGGRLGGVAGIILSVPIALVIQEIVSEMLFPKSEPEVTKDEKTKIPQKRAGSSLHTGSS